jgi:hypothetical protein
VNDLHAVGEDEGDIDEDRRHLPHSHQRSEDDLLRLALEDLNHRCARNPLLGNDLLEDRRLEDAEPDPQTNPDHDDAQQERHAPAPAQELVARQFAERQDREVGEEKAGRSAELRPGRDEPMVFARAAHSIDNRTEPPHSPPTPIPWMKRRMTITSGPQMPICS